MLAARVYDLPGVAKPDAGLPETSAPESFTWRLKEEALVLVPLVFTTCLMTWRVAVVGAELQTGVVTESSTPVVTVSPKAKALPVQATLLPMVMPAASMSVPAKVEFAPSVVAPVGVQNTSQTEAPARLTCELATVVRAPVILKM